ncbi:conserved hypothetical protein [Ricinus communis]|uniref:Uncharacterized protein n=1 Tax=Ricinus communis TaxID=3988 RepID=B9S0Z7_RICCO|nr:conserved hypothetical protein [Ricinus communis]
MQELFEGSNYYSPESKCPVLRLLSQEDGKIFQKAFSNSILLRMIRVVCKDWKGTVIDGGHSTSKFNNPILALYLVVDLAMRRRTLIVSCLLMQLRILVTGLANRVADWVANATLENSIPVFWVATPPYSLVCSFEGGS